MVPESGIKIDVQVQEPFSDNWSETILQTCKVYGVFVGRIVVYCGIIVDNNAHIAQLIIETSVSDSHIYSVDLEVWSKNINSYTYIYHACTLIFYNNNNAMGVTFPDFLQLTV